MDYRLETKFKKVLIVIIAVALVTGGSLSTFADNGPKIFTFSDGEGTKNNPYLISSSDDLIALSNAFLDYNNIRDSHFKLTTDIDLGETVWEPILKKDKYNEHVGG